MPHPPILGSTSNNSPGLTWLVNRGLELCVHIAYAHHGD